MLMMLIVPLIVTITFWIFLRSPNKIPKHDFECQCNRSTSDQDSATLNEWTEFSTIDKIRYMPSLMKYMVPLFLIFLFEYFINQGLVSKMQKKNKEKINSNLLVSIYF